MDTLLEYRAEIDRIDEAIRTLFIQRMETVAKISEWKSSHDIPVYDHAREETVVKNSLEAIENPEYRQYFHEVLTSLMKVSKAYQKALVMRGIL